MPPAPVLDEASPAEVAAALDRLAEEAVDPIDCAAFRRAARAIFQQPAGRPARFAERDKNDLGEIEMLLKDGKAKTFTAGARLVARKYAAGSERQIRSIIERLRVKARK